LASTSSSRWVRLRRGLLTPQDSALAAQISDKQALYSSISTSDDELYTTWRKLEAHREFLQLQEVSFLFGCRQLTSGLHP
jgi:hypothetical protein